MTCNIAHIQEQKKLIIENETLRQGTARQDLEQEIGSLQQKLDQHMI